MTTTKAPTVDDDRYMLGLGLTYKLSRWAQVKGEFRQDWLRSNVSGRQLQREHLSAWRAPCNSKRDALANASAHEASG